MTAASIKAIVVALGFIATFVSERRWPAEARSTEIMRVGRNLGLAACNFVLGLFVVVPVSLLVAGHHLNLRPGWWGMILDLLLLDLWIYFWHRANHLLPFLWRFHEVHHLDENLDATSALRFHFGEVALSALARGVVIWILAIPLNSILIFETLVALAAIFHHSNLKLPPRFEAALSWVIVTPRLHWVHHHALRVDTDSNYATVLSIWDRIFSSRSLNHRKPWMKLGVEGRVDRPLLQLLLKPFVQSDRAQAD